MLIQDFIPCIHLEDYRKDYLEVEDSLGLYFACYISEQAIPELTGVEEYQRILSDLKADPIKEVLKKNPQKIILIELIAGSISLGFREKELIKKEILSNNLPEHAEFQFIELLLDERIQFFQIYQEKDTSGWDPDED